MKALRSFLVGLLLVAGGAIGGAALAFSPYHPVQQRLGELEKKLAETRFPLLSDGGFSTVSKTDATRTDGASAAPLPKEVVKAPVEKKEVTEVAPPPVAKKESPAAALPDPVEPPAPTVVKKDPPVVNPPVAKTEPPAKTLPDPVEPPAPTVVKKDPPVVNPPVAKTEPPAKTLPDPVEPPAPTVAKKDPPVVVPPVVKTVPPAKTLPDPVEPPAPRVAKKDPPAVAPPPVAKKEEPKRTTPPVVVAKAEEPKVTEKTEQKLIYRCGPCGPVGEYVWRKTVTTVKGGKTTVEEFEWTPEAYGYNWHRPAQWCKLSGPSTATAAPTTTVAAPKREPVAVTPPPQRQQTQKRYVKVCTPTGCVLMEAGSAPATTYQPMRTWSQPSQGYPVQSGYYVQPSYGFGGRATSY